MNAEQLAELLMEHKNLRVVHDDCEWGISAASFNLRKVVAMANHDRGSLRELGSVRAYDEQTIATLREQVAAFPSRDLVKEHAADYASNMATYEELKSGGETGKFLSTWLTMTPELDEYVSIFTDQQLTHIEMLRRIDHAEYTIVIGPSDEK